MRLVYDEDLGDYIPDDMQYATLTPGEMEKALIYLPEFEVGDGYYYPYLRGWDFSMTVRRYMRLVERCSELGDAPDLKELDDICRRAQLLRRNGRIPCLNP